jgi:hypothetical protein
MTGEDNDFYFFEAKTPGFSPFAITADVASKNVTENEQINAASSYDNYPDIGIEEIEVEEVSDDSSTYNKEEISSVELDQNGVLLLLCSFSIILMFRRIN